VDLGGMTKKQSKEIREYLASIAPKGREGSCPADDTRGAEGARPEGSQGYMDEARRDCWLGVRSYVRVLHNAVKRR